MTATNCTMIVDFFFAVILLRSFSLIHSSILLASKRFFQLCSLCNSYPIPIHVRHNFVPLMVAIYFLRIHSFLNLCISTMQMDDYGTYTHIDNFSHSRKA